MKPQQPSYSLCLAAVLAAVIIWSGSLVGTKMVMSSFPPVTVAALRFCLAALIVQIIYLFSPNKKPLGEDAKRVFINGFVFMTGLFVLQNIGVGLSTAADAALIFGAFPALTVALEFIIYRRGISLRTALGLLLALVGVAIVIRTGVQEQGGGTNRLLGDLCVVAAGVMWAFYSLFTQQVVKRQSMISIMRLQTQATALGLSLVALLEHKSWKVPYWSGVAGIVYLSLSCSLGAFFLYNFGLKRVRPVIAVNMMNLIPVLGVLLSVLLLGENFGWIQLLGGVVVIAGIYLSTQRNQQSSADQAIAVQEAKLESSVAPPVALNTHPRFALNNAEPHKQRP